MILYMCVTKDKYELPLAVADNVLELAELRGTTKQSIFSSISHAKSRKQNSPYRKVEVPDDDAELWEGGNWDD